MEILNNFSSIYCFIAFVIGAVFMLAMLSIAAMGKDDVPRNKVHFYVARDMDDRIYLYLGKPQRRDIEFGTNSNCKFIATEDEFKKFNLKVEDFKNLKWEDEPVEVFINFED